ncbi:PH domain protein (macronuclear) [Tetrahymena thermophila SB210]|uniref:PH domain protein n=1 Tax=Tetrahymena thermophila (strain SB210) TaxID=312017 RepID=Q22YW0_TETTS|nr:PH domain protein [Tetrahymena thermophila SB210]EAR90561.2 PH domain protein [Tetrahymena thermophila SB210]|eukprot:XP_001010806.2 PH domain protein [Tetrahymena thermophila SB210]
MSEQNLMSCNLTTNDNAYSIKSLIKENGLLKKLLEKREKDIICLKTQLEKEMNTAKALERSKQFLSSQLNSIRNFVNKKTKSILENLIGQPVSDDLQLQKQAQLIAGGEEIEDQYQIQSIYELFTILEERITAHMQTIINRQIDPKQDGQRDQLYVIGQTQSIKQIDNEEKEQIKSNLNGLISSDKKAKKKQQQSVKIVTFQEDQCIQRKDEETIMLGSYKSSSDEQDVMSTSINNYLTSVHTNKINNLTLGSQDILVSPILKSKQCSQKQKNSQFFSFYDEDMRDMVANSQEQLNKNLKNSDSPSQNLPQNQDCQYKNILSYSDCKQSEEVEKQNLNIHGMNNYDNIERKLINKSKSLGVIEQNNSLILNNKSKRLNSATPTNHSLKKKQQETCHFQKKSFFWCEQQLKSQEEQQQQIESDISSRSCSDFLKLKSNSNFSNLINKNKPDKDQEEENQLIFSDKVIKHSKTGASQEIIILLDQTYFYVFQNLSQINNFKRFYIKDINQINTSSKDSIKGKIDMFQSLISSVLDKVAGEYVLGLNKENLNIGIFSGEVKIENVSLNPNIVNMLELPINHQYSSIKKLELKVPLKNIGSMPVEVFLDGLYLIATPKEQKEWKFKDYNSFKTKLANVEAFAAECVQKIAAKQKEKLKGGQEAGYIQKLTMKIVDNLQITIRNIHVRFEDTLTKRYSWGFCLDKLEIYTTNIEGVKVFVDRTIQENKDKPIRKLLTISNAGVYWNANETRLISDLNEEVKFKILNGMIQKEGQDKTDEPVDFLFKISSQVNLTINNKGNFDVPEIKVILNLEHITLHLQQRQLQQLIEQIEFLSKYSRELEIRKKNEKKISAKEIEALGDLFTNLYTKMQEQKKDKSIACLTEKEKHQFEEAIIKLDMQILLQRTKKIVIQVQRALKIKELEKKKFDEKQGFFARWLWGSRNTNSQTSLVTEEEKAEIDNFIDEIFGEEKIDAPTIIRPQDYVYFVLDYNLHGASIKLSNRVGQEIQSLQFSLNSIYGSVWIRENNKQIWVNLRSMELQMIDEFLQNNSYKVINILSPTIQNSKNPLIEFKMTSKPLETPHIDQVIDIKMRSIRADYNPYLVIRAVQFFDVKVKDDQLKQKAKDKIAEQIEKKQSSLSETMKNASVLKLKIDLESPVIVLPFKTDGSLTNECWVLNLGNLSVYTLEDILKPTLPIQMKVFDMFSISLSKIKLSYFPSIEYYNNYIANLSDLLMNIQSPAEKRYFHTIEEFSIKVRIIMVKGPAQGKVNRPNMQIKGGIDQINLKLKPSIYKKLLKLGQCFAVPDEEKRRNSLQTLDQVELEKNLLLKNSTKIGIIYKRGNALKTWEKYNGILSGGYLYLFENPKDLKPVEYIWVKNSTITPMDENLVGFNSAFNVKNRYVDAYFACEKSNLSQQWMEAIDQVKTTTFLQNTITDDEIQQLIEFQEKQESEEISPENKKKSSEQNSQYFDVVQMEVSFELGQIQLSMFDENKYYQKPFLAFQTNKLQFFYQQKKNMAVDIGLEEMMQYDSFYQQTDYFLNDFAPNKCSDDAQLFTNKTIIQTNLQNTLFKIYFSDLKLINKTIRILLEDMQQKPNGTQDQQVNQNNMESDTPKSQQTYTEDVQFSSEEDRIKKKLEDEENQIVALAKSEKSINIFNLDADLQGFQICIINDLNSSYVPIFDLNIFEMNVKLKQSNIQLSVVTMIQFNAAYYNPRVSLWEPIIENAGFSIDFIKSQLSNIKQLIVIEMNPNYPTFNLTFSTQLLSIMTKSIKIAKQEISQKSQKDSHQYAQCFEDQIEQLSIQENCHYASPYTIRNETGYPIEVLTDLSNLENTRQKHKISRMHKKIYSSTLMNYEEKNFEIDMKESDIINDPIKKQTFVFKKYSDQVKVKVQIPGFNLKYIEQVDLDKVRNRLRACKNKHGKKLFDVITEVKLDPVSLKKILNISSPYYFENDCFRIINIQLYDEKKNFKLEFTVMKGQKVPIPIDLQNGFFKAAFYGDTEFSDSLSINKLCNKYLNQEKEIKLGDTFLIFKVHKDIENDKRFMICIEPPYKIKNCLPKTITIQFINHKKVTAITQSIPSGDIFEFYNCSQDNESFMKIQIPGHFWSNEAKISQNVIEKIMIKDVNGNQSEIICHQRRLEHQNIGDYRQFYIYCKGYLINESPYKLNIYTANKENKNECKLVGGQQQIYPEEALNTNIILFGQEIGDLMSLSDVKFGKVSQQASIGGVGNTQIDLQTFDAQGATVFQTMGINVSLENVDQEQKLFSKVITISPRFIIVNKTGQSIQVRQSGFGKSTTIEKDSRIPLQWYDQREKRYLNLKILEDKQYWKWSGNLNVLELGTVNFLTRNLKNKMEITFLRIDVRSDASNIFIVVEKVNEKERPYLIKNYSRHFKIELQDLHITLPAYKKNDSQFLRDQHKYYFSWEHPFDKERKVVSCLIPNNQSFQKTNLKFSPDEIYFQDKIQILPVGQKDPELAREQSLYIKYSIDIDGFTKIIRFEDSSLEDPVDKKEKAAYKKKLQQDKKRRGSVQQIDRKEINITENTENDEEQPEQSEQICIQQQISIYIKDFGLSVIQNHRINEKPTEFLYLTIKGLEFISVAKEESKTYQLRIKLLNIDQNNSYSIVNPVIFTPQKYIMYSSEASHKFFMNVMIEQNLYAKNITLYNNIVIEIDPFAVRIEEQFILTLLDFLKAIREAKQEAETQNVNTLKEYLEESQQIEKIQNTKFKWQDCEIPPTSIPTFVNQLILSNIELSITFKANLKAKDSDLNIVFTALGVALADIEAPIKLKGIRLINCFETVPGIISKLTSHYKDQAITQVLKACGSFNIIGNPVGLFQNISTGVNDLLNKPAEGFVQGPLEGGLGIMQGTSSLIKNTMAGAFYSVNKFTGSLSSGISALCMDEEYLKERDILRSKKPEHFVDGAVQGATSIYSGVANGIAGVFIKPLEGAQRGGALGLLKGIGEGIAGLFVKPVSGFLDAVSSVADGIKNTITYGDDKANEKRLRYPRVFYGREGFYKEYIDLDAGMKLALQLVSKGKFRNSDFLQTFLIQIDENNKKINNVLVITFEIIMLFDEIKKKKKWYFSTSDLAEIELEQNGIFFSTTKKIKKQNSKEVLLQIPCQEQKEYIFKQINTLKFQLEEERKIEELDK